MLSMGITLSPKDFARVATRPNAVLLNFALCYGMMPVLGLGLGKLWGLDPAMVAGMVLVGAPVLFNGLYRAVCAFADPVTVKKVRFAKSPDGGGGGKPWDSVADALFDAEHKAWLETEMRENRAAWRTRAKHKSWLAAALTGDGNCHGWQSALDAHAGARDDAKKRRGTTPGKKKDADVPLDENGEPLCRSVPGHDIRGCAAFLAGEAGAAARRAALARAAAGRAARGVVLAAARRNGASADALFPSGVADDAGDVFYDAEEHAFACDEGSPF